MAGSKYYWQAWWENLSRKQRYSFALLINCTYHRKIPTSLTQTDFICGKHVFVCFALFCLPGLISHEYLFHWYWVITGRCWNLVKFLEKTYSHSQFHDKFNNHSHPKWRSIEIHSCPFPCTQLVGLGLLGRRVGQVNMFVLVIFRLLGANVKLLVVMLFQLLSFPTAHYMASQVFINEIRYW